MNQETKGLQPFPGKNVLSHSASGLTTSTSLNPPSLSSSTSAISSDVSKRRTSETSPSRRPKLSSSDALRKGRSSTKVLKVPKGKETSPSPERDSDGSDKLRKGKSSSKALKIPKGVPSEAKDDAKEGKEAEDDDVDRLSKKDKSSSKGLKVPKGIVETPEDQSPRENPDSPEDDKLKKGKSSSKALRLPKGLWENKEEKKDENNDSEPDDKLRKGKSSSKALRSPKSPHLPKEPETIQLYVPLPESYRQEEKDETVRFLSRPFDAFPQVVQNKIINQGIDPTSVTGKPLDYLLHVSWFLNRKEFEPGFACYERTKDPVPQLSEKKVNEVKAIIQNFDGPIKKVFPSLDFSAEGGFGQVFVGKMLTEKKKKLRVAIKKLPHNAESLKSNYAEIYFLSHISHPNLVKFLCCYFCPGDPKGKTPLEQGEHLMVAMEWLEGGTLNQAANSGGKFEDHHVAFVARECFRAIQYLHERNFVHRDLKSSNIMLSTLGEVKIIDFGLCLDLTEGRRNKMLGSPMWIPPEMIHCRPHGTPADIWSMGVCILELLIGGPPMKKTPIKCMFTAATQGLAHLIPPTTSANGQSFVQSCLTMDPDVRPTATDLLAHPWVSTETDLSRGIQAVLKQVFLVKNLSNMGF